MAQTSEKAFEIYLEQMLVGSGWQSGTNAEWDKDRVYRKGEYPKPKKDFYAARFKNRRAARVFCRNRMWAGDLTIVHPDGTEEKFHCTQLDR